MSDQLIFALALFPILVVVYWWFYSLGQMKRNTDDMRTIMRRPGWKPFSVKDGRYSNDIPRQPWAYRVYDSFVAFLDDHICLDGADDSDGADRNGA